MQSSNAIPPVEIIPSGSLRLDKALGIGGIPRGYIVEIVGPVSSGKTTLCQHIIANAQQLGDICALIDTDHTLDPSYASQCGVDIDQLYTSTPSHAEQALETAEILTRSGSMGVIILDSVSTLIPHDEIQAPLGEDSSTTGDDLLSQSLRKLNLIIQDTKTTLVFTNQVKRWSSAVYHQLAQHPTRLAIKLHAALRLDLIPKSDIHEAGGLIGKHIQIRVVKNKLFPCFDSAEFDIMYNRGINRIGEIFDLGVELFIIRWQRKFYYFQNQQLGIGREEAVMYLEQNLLVAEQIEQVIRQKLFSSVKPPSAAQADASPPDGIEA
jgi:recombination protein RecA